MSSFRKKLLKWFSLPNSASGISHACRNTGRVNEVRDNMWDTLLKQKLLLRPEMTEMIPEGAGNSPPWRVHVKRG